MVQTISGPAAPIVSTHNPDNFRNFLTAFDAGQQARERQKSQSALDRLKSVLGTQPGVTELDRATAGVDPLTALKMVTGRQQAAQAEKDAFGEETASALANILQLPEEQRPAVFAELAPKLMERAESLNIEFDPDPTYNETEVQAFVSQYGKLPNAKAGGKLVKAIGPDGKPTFVRESEAEGMQPFSQPLVTIDQTQQKAEDKAFGADLVDEFKGVRERAAGAEEELATLRLMRNTLKDQGLKTGAVEPLRNSINAVAKSLGVPIGKDAAQQVVDAQTFRALGGQILANRLAAQKGPQTDQDAARMQETLAGLEKEGEANDFLLRSGIALRSREVEQRNFFDAYRREKGTLDGAREAWQRFKEKVPLFGVSPNTGRPIFFTEYLEANQDSPFDEVVAEWTSAYAPR